MSAQRDLQTTEQPGALAHYEPPAFARLSTFGDSAVVPANREDWLATISAGDAAPNSNGFRIPFASRDGTIHVHDESGRAPILRDRLAANDWKHLTIAFPSNNIEDFVQEHFTIYSSSMLVVFGDAKSLTYNKLITPAGEGKKATIERHVYPAGSNEYEALRTREDCKVSTSIFFTLARWDGLRSHIEMPDGLGFYRLRTTSHNSVDNLYAALSQLVKLTHGQIAGIPFDVFLTYRDTSDRTGTRRKIPVWTFSVRPPEVLTSQNWREVAEVALAEGERLQLMPGPVVTEEFEEGDYRELGADDEPISEVTEEDARYLREGGRADARDYERRFFAAVKGTRLDQDTERFAWLKNFTNDATGSLSVFLSTASVSDADQLLVALYETLLPEVGREAQQAGRTLTKEEHDNPENRAAWVNALVEQSAARGPEFSDPTANPIFNGGQGTHTSESPGEGPDGLGTAKADTDSGEGGAGGGAGPIPSAAEADGDSPASPASPSDPDERATAEEKAAYIHMLGMVVAGGRTDIDVAAYDLNLETAPRAEVLRLGHQLKLKLERAA